MKDGFVKVAAASPSLRVCDTDYNAEKIIELIDQASKDGVKVLVFPELAITGYTAGDLFLQERLLCTAEEALDRIIKHTEELDMIVFVGFPFRFMSKLYNTAAVISSGELLAIVPKRNIPNYGEFYEMRWFAPSPDENRIINYLGFDVLFGSKVVFQCSTMQNLVIGAELCEDLWVAAPPSIKLAENGANVIVNLSASDEIVGKDEYRESLVKGQSARLLSAYVYADASEGESTTDMVFAGCDLIAENGSLLAKSPFPSTGLLESEVDVDRLAFERARMSTFISLDEYDTVPFSLELEDTLLTRTINRLPFVPSDENARRNRLERILTLQAMGLKKRLEHTGAKRVVVGLSGGLDSTLALLVAVKAYDMLSLPRDGIIAITMPCFGTTKRTKSNAEKLASALSVDFKDINITKSVLQHFDDIGHSESVRDVTYENSQARERTQVLMDIANKESALVIGTGDLSELALGWATYNGDHMSMYGVNAGVPKTLVRYLVDYYAQISSSEVATILYDILATPVSPELLPAKDGVISQVTEDIVGPYELHDFFLYYIVRQGFGPAKVFRLASIAFCNVYEKSTIKKWLVTFISRFFSQQFKRSCLPDGPKVGTITLSPRGDWRMPSDAKATIWLEEAKSIKV